MLAWVTIELKCRGGVMGIIMIKCPETGRDVSTGIETMGIEELPAVTAKMVCPACGGVHDWITTNAWLAPAASSTGSDRRLRALRGRRRYRATVHRQLEFARVGIRARLSPRPGLPSLRECHAFGCGTIRI